MQCSPFIATIDDDVSRLHVLAQLINGLIHRCTCLDKDHYTPAHKRRAGTVTCMHDNQTSGMVIN